MTLYGCSSCFLFCFAVFLLSNGGIDCLQVFNAMKYATAFPVIIFSAMKYQVPAAGWKAVYKPLWLGAALLNSSFSYFWDIERDWEIQLFTSPGRVCLAGL